jgi:hypothetical protein
LRRVSGMRRKASKFRKRAASASLTSPGVRVAAGRQPPRRIRARVCGSALAVSRSAGDLDEVEPAQQSSAAALPHAPQAINHLKIAEQGLDAPPVGIRLDDGRGGQGGIGGQQQAHPAGALRQLAPPDDDTLEEARAAHGMAQPGRPAAIAGNGVDRGGQCCNRVGIKARAIEPAPPSGLARRRQREQGGVAWPMTSWPRRRAVRISEPRMASSSRHEGADRAEQSLGDGELAGIAGTSAQAGDQRHRALPARHHGGQRDKALAPQERRALAAWSKRTATPGAWAEHRGASVYRLRRCLKTRCLKTRRSRRSTAAPRSHVGQSGTAPRSGRAAGTVRASSGRPASPAAASGPALPG